MKHWSHRVLWYELINVTTHQAYLRTILKFWWRYVNEGYHLEDPVVDGDNIKIYFQEAG
jgi:hypothetical protein